MSYAGAPVRFPRSPSPSPPPTTAARHYFPASRHGSGGKDPASWPATADVCLGWAWGVCLLVLIVAWIVLTIIYVVKVAGHQSQVRLAAAIAMPATAGIVQTSGPVQIYVRQQAGTTQTLFAASNGSGKVAMSPAISDYSAAVRFVPTKQKADGVLSDGDEAKLLFIRDGVWLTATGDLSPDAGKAAAVAVKGAGQGEVIRASAVVHLGTPGATAGGSDPIAAALQSQGAGSSILPFLNGSGC